MSDSIHDHGSPFNASTWSQVAIQWYKEVGVDIFAHGRIRLLGRALSVMSENMDIPIEACRKKVIGLI